MDFVDHGYFHAEITERLCISLGCVKGESHVIKFACQIRKLVAVGFSHAEKNARSAALVLRISRSCDFISRRDESFEDCLLHCGSDAQNFTGGFHLRSKVCVHVHEFFKTEHGNLYRKVRRIPVKTCSESHVADFLTEHGTGRKKNHWNAGHLADVWNRSA